MLGRDSLRYVSVRNIGVKTLRIHDRDLPGGYIDIEPGQEYPMPIGTYRRNIRRMGLVGLQRTDLIPQDPEPIPQEELAEEVEAEVGEELESEMEAKLTEPDEESPKPKTMRKRRKKAKVNHVK